MYVVRWVGCGDCFATGLCSYYPFSFVFAIMIEMAYRDGGNGLVGFGEGRDGLRLDIPVFSTTRMVGCGGR